MTIETMQRQDAAIPTQQGHLRPPNHYHKTVISCTTVVARDYPCTTLGANGTPLLCYLRVP